MNEFDIIRHYFKQSASNNEFVRLGIGDDAAVLAVPAGHEMAVSIDTMLQDRHFFADTAANSLGHKVLAINLSDMAAMGARPVAFVCSLTLPSHDEAWLHGFAQGLFQLASEHDVSLVGGDLCRGPLSISITIHGIVPVGKALKRFGANVGDDIYVSGELGAAGLAVDCIKNNRACPESAKLKLERPTPRVALGLALRNIATACIDISDGLVQDLSHILQQSGVGADVDLAKVPGVKRFALNGGDDYELCFTAPESASDEIKKISKQTQTDLQIVGKITSAAKLSCIGLNGELIQSSKAGYKHF